MDAILDLTARAVSLIVLIQDSLIRLKKNNNQPATQIQNDRLFNEFENLGPQIRKLDYFIENGTKIIWVSIEPPSDKVLPTQYCYERCHEVINWINSTNNYSIFHQRFSSCKYFPAPEQWREAIRTILYAHKNERILLANALQYLPVQIALTAEKVSEMNAKEQRLLQIWNVSDENDLSKILSFADVKRYEKLEIQRNEISEEADDYMKDEKKLIGKLKNKEIPLSFLQIFNCELLEIHEARLLRRAEITDSDHLFTLTANDSPSAAGDMKQQTGLNENEENVIKKNRSDNFEKIFENVLKKTSGTIPPKIDQKSNSKINYVPDTQYKHEYGKDVLQSAKNMDLWALAFSGGGIRSATFNLGVLQGLAKKGLLSKFDYLSTVSGGGYIGSWLVSWIARNRSVIKIGDRLDPVKSSDPLAEEVHPIRWLRMYSNYLTPKTGIMSADSWTVGMTLIRNMLVNQLVILSLFLTLIALGRTVFRIWLKLTEANVSLMDPKPTGTSFYWTCALFLLVAAVLAGLGMQAYHKEGFPKITVNSKLKSILTHLLIGFGCLSALMLSMWLYRHSTTLELRSSPNLHEFASTFQYFLPVMGVAYLALLVVAFLGRYDRCIVDAGGNPFLETAIGIILSAAAVGVGGILLSLVGQFAFYLGSLPYWVHCIDNFGARLSFIFLPPLVIEVISITVVLRMAFLGRNFPDDRREWWGRIGGLIHRICLIWIVLFGVTMLGKGLLDVVVVNKVSIREFFAVGWGATLVVCLKYAYSGNTSGSESKGNSSMIKEKLALLAPYLFVLGLMAFLPQLFENIIKALEDHFQGQIEPYQLRGIVTLCFVAITYILARQIGVNQFSMHLFYRNRLIRGYLGATRIRLERQRSANPFTGFDNEDDLLLAKLHYTKDYFGPYPLINTTLSASTDTALDRQDRKAESFIFSPLFSGFDFSRTRDSANAVSKLYDYAYRPTGQYGYTDGPHIGTAMAISGAAANPNMGYHTSAATAFLLALFNIRLGWWMGNPRMAKWKQSDPDLGLGYLISDLTGSTSTKRDFVCLSDGAHFDNMGLYELIRRKCRYIILSDAEQDETLLCEGLANAVRRCRIDFGVEFTFEGIKDITNLNTDNLSKKNYAIGKIIYPENEHHEGILIYIKSSMIEDESIDLQEYRKKNKTFPHQTTADQFFNEEQFESYRKLGMNIVDKIFR
jgi:hypothetical protein